MQSGAAYVRRGGAWVLAIWLGPDLLLRAPNPLPVSHPGGFPPDHCLLGLFAPGGRDHVGAILPDRLAELLRAGDAVDLFAPDAAARAGNRPRERVDADRAMAREMLAPPLS